MEPRTATQSAGVAAASYAELLKQAMIPARECDVDPYGVDLDPWLYMGDPLAEAAWESVRAANGRDRNIVRTLRQLREDGDAACRDLLTDVESVPSWADFDHMYAGAAWAARNPIGMLLGLVSALPISYCSANTAAVLTQTGNLVSAVPRRVFETSGLFFGALDVESMRPGGSGWEQLVRIRMMHTMVRTGLLRSGRWPENTLSPINTAETALGPYMFGTLRARVIAEVGPPLDDEEIASFSLMWRYISRLMGSPPELTCATQSDQDILDRRLVHRVYSPSADSEALVEALLDGLPNLNVGPALPRPVVAALTRRLLRPGIVPGVDLDVPNDLHVPHQPGLLMAVRAGMTAARVASRVQRIPAARRFCEKAGAAWLTSILERGLDGSPAEYAA